jgi:2-polyprenyl-3-methyl-5-hydroxy-6-metoxy-1,4-benzoquinol methylase
MGGVSSASNSRRKPSRTCGKQGLHARAGTIDRLDQSRDGPFDVVVILHVLEHLSDLVAALKATRRLLAPGGAVYVATPTLSSLEYRFLCGLWLWVDPQAHLCLFSPRS